MGVVFFTDGGIYNVFLGNYSITTSPGFVIKDIKKLTPLSTLTINIDDIPNDVGFVLVESHAYEHYVSLSYTEMTEPHLNINGTNIGLVQEINVGQTIATMYLHNPKNNSVTVLITVQAYGTNGELY